MTDALMAAANNAAHLAGGVTITTRWIDIVDPKPEDTRSGQEVVSDLREKMKRDFGGEN